MNPSRPIKVISGLVAALAFVGAPPGDAAPFVAGDVFVNVPGGTNHFSSSLVLKDTYVPDKSVGAMFGMAFGPSGDLYIAQYAGDPPPYGTGPTVRRLSHKDGSYLGTFGSGYGLGPGPQSLVFDKAGNLYVGEGDAHVFKFSPSGSFLAGFNPASQGSPFWIDLAADQKTLFYTTGAGPTIYRFDVSSFIQMQSFVTLPGRDFNALRLLPDGGLLVAADEEILRLDAEGKVIQRYDILSEDSWFALTLDPDGKSFWSGGHESDTIYQFDIANGNLLNGTVAYIGDHPNMIAGLAVFPGLRRTRNNGFSALGETTLDLEVSAPATLFLLTAGLLVAGLGHARRRTQRSSPPSQ